MCNMLSCSYKQANSSSALLRDNILKVTWGCHLSYRYLFLISHKAENTKYGETGVDAGGTVNNGDQNGISVIIIILIK